MANPSRDKGTAWETELLGLLRGVFGEDVHRAPLRGARDAGDFVGTPMVVEAKSTKSPRLIEWATRCATACGFHRSASVAGWVIAWHGDRRKHQGPVAVMPLDYWLELERDREAHRERT